MSKNEKIEMTIKIEKFPYFIKLEISRSKKKKYLKNWGKNR